MKEVSFLIKPASSLCNLRCIYCFYMDEAEMRSQNSYGIMRDETMHRLIEQACSLDVEQINFCFQGGEPTVAGCEYFHKFINHVNKVNQNKKITYAIQTNGTLINQEWISIFKENDFLVGISLDGFVQNHDFFRKDANQEGTFDRIINNIKLLEDAGINYNILTVLTRRLAQRPNQLFDFYMKYNFKYVQLIPCLPSLESNSIMDRQALRPRDFSEFYKKFFDRWFDEYVDGNYISVTLFDNLIPMYKGLAPSQCGMLGKCQLQMVVEGDGSIYPCDFYVLDTYKCGNINENSLDEIMHAKAAKKFLGYKRELCKECKNCSFINMCHGNCRRLSACYYNENYCGYKDFLQYTYSRMNEIARTI